MKESQDIPQPSGAEPLKEPRSTRGEVANRELPGNGPRVSHRQANEATLPHVPSKEQAAYTGQVLGLYFTVPSHTICYTKKIRFRPFLLPPLHSPPLGHLGIQVILPGSFTVISTNHFSMHSSY